MNTQLHTEVLQKLTRPKLVRQRHAFLETRMFIAVFTKAQTSRKSVQFGSMMQNGHQRGERLL